MMITVDPFSPNTDELRTAFGCFPSGVVAVAAIIHGEPTGMAASAFTAVSLDPPLVSLCIQNTSNTWPNLMTSPRIGISVLGEEQGTVCRALAAKSGNRFEGLEFSSTPDGAAFIHGASVQLDCSIESQLPGGDHTIVLLRIHSLLAEPEIQPLIFHGSKFHRFPQSGMAHTVAS